MTTTIACAAAGFVLGMAYFAGLWLTVRQVAAGVRGAGWMAVSSIARLALAGGAFYGLTRYGGHAALAGLAGFCVSRWSLTSWLGRIDRAE